MPGIFGCAGTTLTGHAAGLLDAMAQLMKHHPWYDETRHVDEGGGIALGRMALGFTDHTTRAAATEDDSLVALLDGEIYDYAEHRRTLEARGHVFGTSSCAELLLHGLEEEGREFFRKLHGKFIAAIWDRKRRQLILANDRFGMRPLYYAQARGRLVFASEIKAVLANTTVSRSRNLRGIAQFFTFGQLLAGDTLIEAVRLLPAAGWLTYDAAADRVTVERYWELRGHDRGNQSEAQLLDRIDHAFGKAVQRCMSGPTRLGLSLSGGLDARTILGAADDQVPLTTVCIGMDGSMDHRSAEQMARLTGRPHHACFLGEDFLGRFAEHLRHMVRLTDGHYLSQCIVMPTLPVYRELGIQTLLRGHAGELMHMTKAYSFSLDAAALALRDESGLEAWLFRRLQTYMLEGTEGKLFAAGLRRSMEDLARESLRACLKESVHLQQPAQRIAHLFLSQRSRRETALSLVKFGSLVETRLPYVDNELIDALFAAPPELKLDEKIQAHILRRRRPAFLRVPNVNTGTRMGAGRLARLAGRLRQKVFAKLGVRGYQPYERLGLWLRRDLRPLVENLLLSDRCLGRGLFDAPTVRRVVQHHFDGGNHTFLILAMMTYEMGQREFVDGERPASGITPELCAPKAVA
jgi:asparagine synthase (glutamine-hydrolysing)